LTPFPTLAPEAAHALVTELLQTNGGCRLPCWWGFTPGQTSWATAGPYLATFASGILRHVDPLIYLVHFIGLEVTVKGYAIEQEYVVDGESGLIVSMKVAASNKTDYSIPAVLSAYGPPSEIWLYAAADSPAVTQPFYLDLYYGHEGFVVKYYENPRRPTDPLQGCFHLTEERPLLWLWSPELSLTYLEAAEYHPLWLSSPEQSRPLAEVTDLDIATFYEIFKQPDNTHCLETPAAFWTW
ncbi:MAG: hypothetical protein ACRDHL_06070, partial [Candidatus Promineifilaceae bacterium]